MYPPTQVQCLEVHLDSMAGNLKDNLQSRLYLIMLCSLSFQNIVSDEKNSHIVWQRIQALRKSQVAKENHFIVQPMKTGASVQTRLHKQTSKQQLRPQYGPRLENCFRHMIELHVFGSLGLECQQYAASSFPIHGSTRHNGLLSGASQIDLITFLLVIQSTGCFIKLVTV